MRKPLVVALIVAALTWGGAASWAAGPPYTVSVGGSSAVGVHPVSGTSAGTVRISFKNNSGTVLNYSCTAAAWSGTARSGVGVNPVLDITSSTWTGCTVPGMAYTVSQVGAWNLTGTGSNATTGEETIAGYLGGVKLGWYTTASPSVCSFTLGGSASGSSGIASASFNEATQQLVVDETGYIGNLRLSNVSGCLGQLQNGNPADLQVTFNVSSPDGAINLS